MGFTKYRAFVHVVECGSLTKAAVMMGYSQPGVSKMVESLEAELKVSLFVRNGSSLKLTENGRRIYAYCKEIVQRYDDMINVTNAMNGLLTTNLRIGAVNSMMQAYVPQLIKAYSDAYPSVLISLDELNSYDIIDALKNNNIDVGFTNSFDLPGMEFVPLFNDPVRLIVNTASPLASKKKIPVSALNGCNIITIPSKGDDLIAAVRKTYNFNSVSRYTVHSDAAAIAMVSAGLGSYIISEMQCHRLPENVVKLEFKEDIHRVMGMGFHTYSIMPPALEEMKKAAAELAVTF